MKTSKKTLYSVIAAGLLVGIAAVVLTKLGNPKNMGFCIACFLRDIAGATKLHTAAVVQYARPEIPGLVLGSFFAALATKEFRPKAGSSPALRFLLGAFVMVGALAFLGCPLRMVIRMGSGDLNAFVGFAGFVLGILAGVFFLKKGFNLGRAYDVPVLEGAAFPAVSVIFILLAVAAPTLFAVSEKGPGSMHAPIAAAFLLALAVGAFAQRSRLCMVGGTRNAIMFKDFELLIGFGLIFAAVLIGNVILGNFKGFSTVSQPVSHSSQLWNLLGMAVVGWGCTLLGGCPLRQLILAGEGNGDSAVTVLGMVVGAAFSHNFGLAGSADSVGEDGAYIVGGLKPAGKTAVIAILCLLLVISVCGVLKCRKENKE